jgi:hypothetical protein
VDGGGEVPPGNRGVGPQTYPSHASPAQTDGSRSNAVDSFGQSHAPGAPRITEIPYSRNAVLALPGRPQPISMHTAPPPDIGHGFV